jgi:hypothetical protein
VAGGALEGEVLALENETGLAVIERPRRPFLGGVAFRALAFDELILVLGNVARLTTLVLFREDELIVALLAGESFVRSAQGELGLAVVERRLLP